MMNSVRNRILDNKVFQSLCSKVFGQGLSVPDSESKEIESLMEEFDLRIAQACPFTPKKEYKDADFELLKLWLRTALTKSYQQGRADCDRSYGDYAVEMNKLLSVAEEEGRQQGIKEVLDMEITKEKIWKAMGATEDFQCLYPESVPEKIKIRAITEMREEIEKIK